jgi:type IV pilus assembly protein PilA
MMSKARNQKGFSLIELMVVVGIIGILAAIAVPNFTRFQAKSRQSEAKANLGALYSAEKAFFAEWNYYFAAFRDIGFSPEGNLRYRVGFAAAGDPIPAGVGYTGPSNPTGTGATAATLFATNTYCPAALGGNGLCTETPFAQSGALAGTNVSNAVTPQTFLAMASGNIDADAGLDNWTINHAKALVNTLSDL